MTSGRLSVVTGLFETNDATIFEVIRMTSSSDIAEVSPGPFMMSA
jgi:hypothetical protein